MTESQHTEWKESWHDDHLAQVCGFANAQGGTLVIGRNDQGVAVGLRDAKKLLEDLPNKIRDLLGVVAQVDLRHEDGKDLLEITTPAYPNPISYRGHYYLRSGSTLQELKGAPLWPHLGWLALAGGWG
jgi:ATP-dependent DNA helicase RecG